MTVINIIYFTVSSTVLKINWISHVNGKILLAAACSNCNSWLRIKFHWDIDLKEDSQAPCGPLIVCSSSQGEGQADLGPFAPSGALNVKHTPVPASGAVAVTQLAAQTNYYLLASGALPWNELKTSFLRRHLEENACRRLVPYPKPWIEPRTSLLCEIYSYMPFTKKSIIV